MKRLLASTLTVVAFAANAGVPATGGSYATAKMLASLADILKNEAVHPADGGRTVVELPPGPKSRSPEQLRMKTDPWTPGLLMHSYVIATSDGLKECPYAWLDSTCRPYVQGRDKRERAWVVKYSGQWMKCPRRDSIERCVGYYQPSNTEIQE